MNYDVPSIIYLILSEGEGRTMPMLPKRERGKEAAGAIDRDPSVRAARWGNSASRVAMGDAAGSVADQAAIAAAMSQPGRTRCQRPSRLAAGR
jgi:hypothetical protein